MEPSRVLFIFTVLVCVSNALRAPLDKPNIVVLFADDLGYGDLSCNGHPTIKTPNLDFLAENGIKLTTWYSGASVCTPSRAALLTGRLPIRSGLADNSHRVLRCDSEGGLPANETTIAAHLKTVGYKTGMIGKWHLGQRKEYLPPNRGFDFYYGIPFSVDMGSLTPYENHQGCTPLPLIQNLDVIEAPTDLTKVAPRYSEQAVNFIKENKDDPFFLYMAFSHVHTSIEGHWQWVSEKWANTSDRGLFGDATQELDWVAGNIIQTLINEKLQENTLVFFTSDNGPWMIRYKDGGSEGLFTGISAGYSDTGKGSTWEGGVREPGIAWWPGQIKPNTVSDEIVTSYDIFTTVLNVAGVPIPTDRIFDGKDMMPVLKGGKSEHEDLFLYRGATLYAVRHGAYKAHFITKSGYGKDPAITHNPPLLFNINVDPSEAYPLNASQYKDVIAAINTAVEAHKKSLIKGKDQMTLANIEYAVCCSKANKCTCLSDS